MATAKPTKPQRLPVAHPRLKASETLPAYGLGDGILSFRHKLRARERSVIDRALEIVGRYLREPGMVFDSPDAVKSYLWLALAGEGHERFAVLYLDSLNRAVAFEHHFTGTLAQTNVYPREIVTAALRHGAAGVILAHNHPSGRSQPSPADKALTRTLQAALQLIDVRVLDHLIVGS